MEDRRAPGTTRIPFEAFVEVGGAHDGHPFGPTFEAQAVDLSAEGIQLRTAYLPEIGQPLTCRFEAGPSETVIAVGEVIWRRDQGRGGEFGVRFLDLDAASADALARLLQMASNPNRPAGAKVRLHIEGLASPMRARVKESNDGAVTAYSELGFLKVGKALELEDANTGSKRPAHIDRVEIELDNDTQVPQLVVALRYNEAGRVPEASSSLSPMTTSKEQTPEPSTIDEDGSMDAAPPRSAPADVQENADESLEEISSKMKGGFARRAARVAPAVNQLWGRAKKTVSILANKSRSRGDDAIPLRRVTSPPPGGGLHTAGRKVVRGEVEAPHVAEPAWKKHKTKLAVGAMGGVALVLAAVALHKPQASAPAATTPEPVAAAPAAGQTDPIANTTLNAATVPGMTAPGMTPQALPPATQPLASPPIATTAPAMPSGDMQEPSDADDGPSPDKKKTKVAPFTNGNVRHGNMLTLRMDGAVEKIHGATTPTGFTVTIPGRRSLEAAAPLAQKDPRIASIRVANESNGAELTVAFKDGVPHYTVRAKGDQLQIVLANAKEKAESTKSDKPVQHPHKKRHGKGKHR